MTVRSAVSTVATQREPDAGDATVLDALGSERCRTILDSLHQGSLTADELAVQLAIPISTVYRHLGTLTDAGLVTESIRIDLGGRNRREYSCTTSTVTVSFNDGVEVRLHGTDDD